MNPNTNQPQLNSQNIPTPAGYTDEGQPYWFVQGNKIFWAEMQQILVQHLSVSQAKSGGSVEGGPKLTPVIESSMDVFQDTLDANINKAPDAKLERNETGIETKAEQSGTQVSTNLQPKVASPAKAAEPALIGDSPKLKVAVNNPVEMQQFVVQHEKDSPKSSNTFLATFFKKILQALTINGD